MDCNGVMVKGLIKYVNQSHYGTMFITVLTTMAGRVSQSTKCDMSVLAKLVLHWKKYSQSQGIPLNGFNPKVVACQP